MERIVNSIFKVLRKYFPIYYHLISKGKYEFHLEEFGQIGFLYDIPSETSIGERKFLYNFFKRTWDGGSNVVEIGPFLGGTTRAIALGMANNVNQTGASKLYTLDYFNSYYSAKKITEFLAPLMKKGSLTKKHLDSLIQSPQSSFLKVFEAIHSEYEYFKQVEVIPYGLPDSYEANLKSHFSKDNIKNVGVFFIDGCKSWYSTKFFLENSFAMAKPGAYYLFQDYGRFTCFWIPFILEVLNPHMKFCGRIDSTRVFQLVSVPDLKWFNEVLPNRAEEVSPDKVTKVFETLASKLSSQDDYNGLFISRIQNAAMVAYNGDKKRAKEMLTELKSRAKLSLHRKRVKDALYSPTYDVNGPILL